MPVTRMIAALAERLKDDHQQIVPVASLTVIGMNVLDRLERQGMPTCISTRSSAPSSTARSGPSAAPA